jgi:hypothetical protein
MLTLSIVASRYGSGVLEDNFVARIYTSYDSGGQFLALYTVLNCYVYVLVIKKLFCFSKVHCFI